VAKDKKKKNEKKKDKVLAPAENAVSTLKSLGSNKLVGEVVAAALVATAAALRDSDKARRLASAAGDELEKLSKDATQRGSAMWQLAIDVGRRALESVGGEAETRPARAKARTTAKDTSKAKPATPAGAKKAKASAKKA
jgi:hypothetical protein